MGLHHLNLFVFILLLHVLLHCFAFDLVHQSHVPRQREQYLLKNVEKLEVLNLTNPSKQSLYWKRPENDRNIKKETYFWRDLKAVTRLKSSTVTQSKRQFISLISRFIPKSTTPSYIEFDYLDGLQHKAMNTSLTSLDRFGIGNRITKPNGCTTRKPIVARPFFDSYNLFDDPYIGQELVKPHASQIKNRHKSILSPQIQPTDDSKIGNVNKLRVSEFISSIPFLPWKFDTVKVYPKGTQIPTTCKSTAPKLPIHCTTHTKTVFTAAGDRVKFFEMYDNNTMQPPSKKRNLNISGDFEKQLDNMMSAKMNHDAHYSDKLMRCNDLNATNAGKKHKSFKKRSFKSESNSAISNKIQGNKVFQSRDSSLPNTTNTFRTQNKFVQSDIVPKMSAIRWSSYPFASVYVYKPTQTHCDAAGISPHWLLAAGACLSRQTLTHSINARSAFVTYCGEHWRRPQRIAYVKRSVVHPKFNPRDEVRRLFYNIGLIEVSSSMAASCPRWMPVALMSHQFTDQSTGSIALAVGWGLDRYGTKYMSEQLPHWPLTVYEALVYHETCPGSAELSMAKRQEGSGASNVYCLTLPPYTKEETDPVHGGLLLVGGKLVALYLQEERRMHGAQSAQYTGVWRLLPWVMDVAREPDDEEATFDV